jgi:hypothetical protein
MTNYLAVKLASILNIFSCWFPSLAYILKGYHKACLRNHTAMALSASGTNFVGVAFVGLLALEINLVLVTCRMLTYQPG